MSENRVLDVADEVCNALDGLHGPEIFKVLCTVMGRICEQTGMDADEITDTMGKIAYAAIEYQRLMGGRDVH